MTIDLLPIKHQMAAILDLFFNETLKITTSFRNKFSNKNHVEMRGITLKYMSNSSWITTSTWHLAAILNFVKKKDVPLRGNKGDNTGNTRGLNEPFLKFSALYYFFPFQNLKFLDY